MATRFFTGFNGITTAQQARRGLSGINTFSTDGRGSRRCANHNGELLISDAGGSWTGATTWTIGFAFKNSYSSNQNLLRANTPGHFQISYSGTQYLAKDAAGTTVDSHTATLAADTWYFLEVEAIIHASTGRLRVKLDGTLILDSGATIDTLNGASTDFATFGLMGTGNASTECIYINDDSGAAPNNTFLGNCRVDPVATAADSSVQFTPLSSTNESNIDDGDSPDDDTTYNQSTTAGHIDLFTVSGYTAPGTIYSVVSRTVAKKTDTDVRTFRAKLKSSATTLNGTTAALTSSYAEYVAVADTDPNTAAAWASATPVNAMLVGYELVT